MKETIEKLQRLQDFVDFCQIDFGALTPHEMDEIIIKRPYFTYILNHLGKTYEIDSPEIKEIQSIFLQQLNWILYIVNKGNVLEMSYNYLFAKRSDKFILAMNSYQIHTPYEIIIRVSMHDNTIIGMKTLSPIFVDILGSLAGLPDFALRKCPHCGKFFINPTKRKKIYCSKICQNAAGVQRYRERKGE